MKQLEEIIDQNTKGNYLFSSNDKVKMISQILDLFSSIEKLKLVAFHEFLQSNYSYDLFDSDKIKSIEEFEKNNFEGFG